MHKQLLQQGSLVNPGTVCGQSWLYREVSLQRNPRFQSVKFASVITARGGGWGWGRAGVRVNEVL